jgi:hypothetical protein
LEDGPRHASHLEFFFDLVFAVAIAQLAHELVVDHSLGGFATFAALYLPVFIAWQNFSSYADHFDTDDVIFRSAVLGGMLAILAFAVQIPGRRAGPKHRFRDRLHGAAVGDDRALRRCRDGHRGVRAVGRVAVRLRQCTPMHSELGSGGMTTCRSACVTSPARAPTPQQRGGVRSRTPDQAIGRSPRCSRSRLSCSHPLGSRQLVPRL